MKYYDLIWIGLGRTFAVIMFIAIGIYLSAVIIRFFKNPRCPECGSRKKNRKKAYKNSTL